MITISYLFFLQCYFHFSSAFYHLNTDQIIIYELARNSNLPSYFGFSVVPVTDVNSSSIFIGAPGGFNFNYNLTTGTISRCDFGKNCKMFDVLKKNSYKANDEIYKDMHLSFTMDFNNLTKEMTACAPRYKKILHGQERDHLLLGSCFTYPTDGKSVKKFSPLNNQKLISKTVDKQSIYYYGQGEAGFSLHIPRESRHMLLGAPSILNYKGSIVETSEKSNQIPTSAADYNQYFGYSITSGRFFNSKLYYVSSAPRAKGLKGMVLVFTLIGNDQEVVIKDTKIGTQLGEYFGSCLTSGDLNNDGLDDLFVAANFHTSSNYNEGRVYVFLGSKKGRLENSVQLDGQAPGGLFGYAMQFIKGAVFNLDFNILAVSAPYEENGVVYLFKATSNGLEQEPFKIIKTERFSQIKGFGMSISKPFDVDRNGYLDMAIGAPLSGHVILYRSSPVVKILYTLYSHSNQIIDEKNITAKVCFKFKSALENLTKIEVSRKLVIDQSLNRVILNNTKNIKNINITKEWQCESLAISFKPSTNNKLDPLKITLSYKFKPEKKNKSEMIIGEAVKGVDNFCSTCPLEDIQGSKDTRAVLQLTFPLNCGPDNNCIADVEILSKIIDLNESNTFILGSKSYLVYEINVTNHGENAFGVQTLVILPELVNFGEVPRDCQSINMSAILCEIDDILKTNETRSKTLMVDVMTLNRRSEVDYFQIESHLISINANINKNISLLNISLQHQADITITGKSEQVTGNILENAHKLTHLFRVEKSGFSVVHEAVIHIDIPYMIHSSKGDFTFLTMPNMPSGNLAGQPIICSKDEGSRNKRSTGDVKATFNITCSNKEVSCLRIYCSAGPFLGSEVGVVQVEAMLDFAQLRGIVGDQISFAADGVVSVIRPKNLIQMDDKPDFVRVLSEFTNEVKKPVALWIILLSVCVGLLLLIFVIGGLVKVGFFRRKMKEELDVLKHELEGSGQFNRADDNDDLTEELKNLESFRKLVEAEDE